jgi:ribonuclease HII
MSEARGRRSRCTFQFERRLQQQGFRLIAGVDEVGRGALCGPVVAAAVLFEQRPRCRGINDSKQLEAAVREKLQSRIAREALSLGIGIVCAEEIDRINIYRASIKAMVLAVEKLHPRPDFVLIDGNPIRGLDFRSLSVVRGDARCLSIAAASIVAKVTRDRLMASYASMYPMYDWANNKGYSCPRHFEALREHGPTSLHRKSFSPVLQDNQLSLLGEGGQAFAQD